MNTNLIFLKNKNFLFYLLALTGLFLRGLYLFEYSHFVNFDLAIGADTGEYALRAKEILRGIFFPTSPEIHAPLYSFFLAFLQKCSCGIVSIRIIQTLLNYFSWIGLYFLLEKRNFTPKFCLVFLWISMILAPLIFHPAELISESLLLPIFTVIFVFLHFSEEEKSLKREFFSFAAGGFSALALLTHGMISAYPLLQILYFLLCRKWQKALFFTVGVLIVLTPFFALKSVHYKKLTGVQANAGFNIYLGNNPKATGLCYMRPGNLWRKTHVQAEKAAQSRHISTDRFWLEKVWHFWRNTPLKGIKLYFQKIPLIFSGREYIAGADGGFLFCRTNLMNLLRFLTIPAFLLAFYGLWLLYKKKENIWIPPLLLALSLFFMQILTVTSGRYRLMMFPAVVFLAAVGSVHFNWRKWKEIAAVVFLISVWLTYNFMGSDKYEAAALLGEGHFIKGNYEHAEELLTFAGKRFKDSSRIENMLGNIAEKRNDLPLARRFYTRVTKIEPFMPEGWMNLANITPDPRLANQYFLRALAAAAPSPSADLTFNYARFLYAAKRIKESERLLTQTFTIDPDHVMALNLSGIIAVGKKDFSNASQLFYRAASLKPSESGFWKNCAITARMAGDKALEQKAARKFFELQKKKK